MSAPASTSQTTGWRVGALRDLYTRPLYRTIKSSSDPSGELLFDTPSTHIDGLMSNGLNAVFVPPIDFAQNSSGMVLYPNIGVSSTGYSNVIRLFLRKNLPIIRSIAIGPVSTTDVVLTRIVLGEKYDAEHPSIVPVIGYAVIDRTPTSLNSDMAWYQMFYSVQENDSLVEITPKITTEKRNDTLAMWNTSGMKPGQYLLHLLVSDNSTNPVIVEAVHPFSLNPGVFGIEEQNASNVKVFPNPVSEIMHIDAPWPNSTAILYNCKGAVTWKGYFTKSVENIDMSAYPPGLYVLKINHESGTAVSRIIKK